MATKTRVKPDGLRAPYQTEGEVLTVTGAGDIIASGVSGAGPHTLDYHTDVTISGVADNEVLAYDSGGDWINQTAAEAGLSAVGHTHTESDVTDLDHDAVAIRGVDVVGWAPATSGQVLVYDGNVYAPDTVSGVGGMSAHDIEGAYHTLADSVSGYMMQAYSATTFGFSPLLAQDLPAHAPQAHTHVESDVTDLDHDATKLRGISIVDWSPTSSGQVLVYDGSVWSPGTVSGAAGASTFLQLTDTPSSYSTASGYYVVVTGTEDGLEFSAAAPGSGGLSPHALGYHSDVTVDVEPTLLDNEVLAFDSGSSQWINQNASEAGLATAGHSHDHTELTNVTIDQHHPRDHSVDGSTHTLASSVSGYVMQAHSATTFGFTPLLAQDLPSHTHVEANITNLDHDAIKLQGYTISSDTPASGQVLKYDGANWVPGAASGIGATTFTGLDDTPANYTGQSGKFTRVNSAGNALEFVDIGIGVTFEDLTSQIPPNNDFYTVTQEIIEDSAQVYVNGLLQRPSYYTETTSGVFLSETLVSTDEIVVVYVTSGGGGGGTYTRTQGGNYVAKGTGTHSYTGTAWEDITNMSVTFPISASGSTVACHFAATFDQTNANWEVLNLRFELDNGFAYGGTFSQYRESGSANSEKRLIAITDYFEDLVEGTHKVVVQMDEGGSSADWDVSSNRRLVVTVPDGVNITE